jgi:hypothetical protein
LTDVDRLRRDFEDDRPMPGLIKLESLLEESTSADAVSACQQVHFVPWYCYLDDGKRVDRFGVPPDGLDCLAVDFRPAAPADDAPFFEAVASRFSEERNRRFFSDITGVDLRGTDATWMLISWKPHTFTVAHTDQVPGRPTRLAISLSLTSEWNESFGGMTYFRWEGRDVAYKVCPRANEAIVFRPFPGSWHWVEPIAATAPANKRYTLTILYRDPA